MHFDLTLGSILAYEGDFGVTLVQLWGHFGYMMVTLGHFGITMGSLWSHFGYMKVHFQKTHISPTWGELWMTLASF